MKIFINNIEIKDINITNISNLIYKTKYKTDIFSDEGIYFFKKNKLVKKHIIDHNIVVINYENYEFLKDTSIVKNMYNNFQIPINNKIINYVKYYYKVTDNVSFVVHCQDNDVSDFYFKTKYDTNNYKDIVSFLLLLK
jgi:hypothetical protein